MTDLPLDTRIQMDGADFLARLEESGQTFPCAFFDPQYRAGLDKLNYGNEGKTRGKRRAELPQMSNEMIFEWVVKIGDLLAPSGHLFLWMDKFQMCRGADIWTAGTALETVDLVVWDKGVFGNGYRTRNQAEFLVVYQKRPKRVKGVWRRHDIRNVWREDPDRKPHPHAKPILLQAALIEATTAAGDIVIDPAAGAFTVMDAARLAGRRFLGCDIVKGAAQ